MKAFMAGIALILALAGCTEVQLPIRLIAGVQQLLLMRRAGNDLIAAWGALPGCPR
jgi:hypothetical protein